MKQLTQTILVLCLLAIPIASAAEWLTLNYPWSDLLLVNAESTQDGDIHRFQMLEFNFDSEEVRKDVDKGTERSKDFFETRRFFLSVDCRGLRLKADGFAVRESKSKRWSRQDDVPWENFEASEIDKNPMLAYACRQTGGEERWETPDQAREHKWPMLMAKQQEEIDWEKAWDEEEAADENIESAADENIILRLYIQKDLHQMLEDTTVLKIEDVKNLNLVISYAEMAGECRSEIGIGYQGEILVLNLNWDAIRVADFEGKGTIIFDSKSDYKSIAFSHANEGERKQFREVSQQMVDACK
jgi:hypothetical protein